MTYNVFGGTLNIVQLDSTCVSIVKQDHLENADLHQSESSLELNCGSGWLPKFNWGGGASLCKFTSMIKFSWRSDQLFHRYEPNCGKMPCLAVLKPTFKKFLDPDADANDLQNLNLFFIDYRYISDKIFVIIPSVVFAWSC